MLSSVVAWHVGSKRLAEGTADGLIRVWDVEREQTTLILRGPTPSVRFWGVRWLAWSPDGGKLAAGGSNGKVHLWETGTGRELRVFRGPKTPVCSVAFSSDGTRLAAWGEDGTIKIWDAATGRVSADVAHPGQVYAGAWSPDDKLLACGHRGGTVTISGTQAGDKTVTLRGHVGSVSNLAWSPDGSRLAAASRNDFAVRVWDVAAEKVVLGPLRHSHEITALAWEPDERGRVSAPRPEPDSAPRLATGSADETIKLWDATTGREALTLRGHQERITSLAWGPDGRLASGCGDGSVKIWDSLREQEANVLPGPGVRATAVAWSPDGKRLASAGDDGMIRICDPSARAEVAPLQGHDEGRVNQQFGLIRSLAWSPDGTRLASAGLDGRALIWEVAGGRAVFALPADRGAVWSVAWSPDGTRLAAGSEDGTIRVVEGLGHTPKVHVLRAHQGLVRCLAWSPRGDRLASGGKDRLVKVWDPLRGAELARMGGHAYWVMGVAWSPDGTRLASASGDRLVILWDPQTREKLSTLRGHNDFVDAVVWSPDGTQLASAGNDNSVRVWDARTGEEAFILRGSSGMFHDVSWNRDGARLAAASSDGQVRVWDATRGFERDATPRALPYIARKAASGTARGEDLLALAQIACGLKRYALATRLWAEALASDPKRFDDRQSPHRYNAARGAVLAAAGQGLEEPPLDDAAKAKLRGQALDWLKAERAAWGRFLESGSPRNGPNVAQNLTAWKHDLDLAGVRDPAALAKLPADERQEFAQLWADMAALDATLLLLQSGAPPLIRIAAVQAWFGQDGDLAATCDRALRVSKDTRDPTTAERTAKICSLRQADARTHEAALVLARRAIELGEGHEYRIYFRMALGMAEYRSGHYAAAEAALLAAAQLDNNNHIVSVTSAFYRAMSLFRQGKEAEAHKVATAAAAKMKPLPADEKNPLGGNAGADDLILWLAYKEAKALIRFDAAPPASAEGDRR
jgi:WD40 repeat protein